MREKINWVQLTKQAKYNNQIIQKFDNQMIANDIDNVEKNCHAL